MLRCMCELQLSKLVLLRELQNLRIRDTVGMIGTINLDYRSLTHHFENGVWIYNDRAILDMKEDFINTMNSSIYMNDEKIKNNIFSKLIRIIVRVFSPLL